MTDPIVARIVKKMYGEIEAEPADQLALDIAKRLQRDLTANFGHHAQAALDLSSVEVEEISPFETQIIVKTWQDAGNRMRRRFVIRMTEEY